MKKVTNGPKSCAVSDGIIFTLLLFFITEVKGRTLLADMMDWLLDDVHNFGTRTLPCSS